MKVKKNRLFFPLVSVLLFSVDQMMKTYAEQNLELGEEREMKGRIILRRAHNTGMCLNFMQDRPETVKILSASATAAATAVQAAGLFRKGSLLQKTGMALMTAGAWSNTFDRFARGHVVDYAGFRCGKKRFEKVTYNLGDFCIMAGSILAVAASYIGK